ncbi:NAD-dependent succinate-semialdehyde dehydrogenase, partial [Roseisolibacter sp. H3M3-2]|uniref:NAD-dependent succinate-semialdehyde dehydrogenase n=1 Tax=Roseisolibacter sp. H3M3-2 TaxID=3031323 RepID=UPI0023DB4660
EAAHAWRRRPVGERAALVARAAEVLDRAPERLARLMTREMGKPLQAARDEAAKCATACRWYAEHAERILAPQTLVDDAQGEGRVVLQPLGVVLAVMPWNFPFWQVVRFAAPALVAGNVGLLKHASNVPQCALALEAVFREAGAPDGVFQTLLVESRAVDAIVADPRVQAVTLTGSEGAGSAVGATAGRHLKKVVLELGGSDPFVVMPSADVEAAARTAVTARTINNGQSCIAAKRFVVHADVYDAFLARFVEGMRALRVGDPMLQETQVGPLASAQVRDDVADQVRRSVRDGARLACGGDAPAGAGFFYAPTVLAEVPRDAAAAREEVFGPVAAVFRARDLDEAIAIANDTPYGLGASAWSRDPEEQRRLAEELEAGSVFLNAMVVSDPRLPFGGIKRSGHGRELSDVGLREFCNVKTVRVARAPAATAGTTE